MKYKLVTDVEINSVEDLKKLRTIVEANNLDKLKFSEIARNLGIDRRTAKKYYLGDDKKERKKKKSVIDEYYKLSLIGKKKSILHLKMEKRLSLT
ncbi:transposase [Caldisalinibacter kiritimatiensis]|uniref:Transposase n=2 Tax=Caldisalinibacter kiritimatiensis TaxID=1304284 RepID=R1AYF3_9FIRM|nr:transposase [Caldisalinibacter kiritimatiensis]